MKMVYFKCLLFHGKLKKENKQSNFSISSALKITIQFLPNIPTCIYEYHPISAEQKHSAKFIQEIREVRLRSGMTARFEAHFAGNPKPEVRGENIT